MNDRVDESTLRHPSERPIFLATVALNFVLMAVAIIVTLYPPPPWVAHHILLDKDVSLLRVIAISALIGVPLLVLNRNRRESLIRGNSVRISEKQFPEVYAILKDHCRRLGMTEVPELFLTAGNIEPFSVTYSSWRENYIVLHQVLFDIVESKSIDVVAFVLAHELGAIRLKQTAIWNEMLLTYVSAIKWFRYPLERARTYSRDRYGAALSPTGFRGLLINAVGRRLMDQVDIQDYLSQAFEYRGFWAGTNAFFEPKPQVFNRINQLKAAGYHYKPPQ